MHGTEPTGFDVSSLELPFNEFLEFLCGWIDTTVWKDPRAALFGFVRAVKSHKSLSAADVGAAYEGTCNALVTCNLEVPASLGVNLFAEDGAVAFESTWEAVRHRLGVEPMVVAFEASAAGCLTPPKRRVSKHYARFLTVAALLQIMRPEQHILLPYHLLKEERFFAVELNTIQSWIRWAADEHLLKRVREYMYRPGGKGTAAEYVFALHRFRAEVPGLAARIGVRVGDGHLEWTASVCDGTTAT